MENKINAIIVLIFGIFSIGYGMIGWFPKLAEKIKRFTSQMEGSQSNITPVTYTTWKIAGTILITVGIAAVILSLSFLF